MKFIDRAKELEAMEEKWSEGRSHLFVLYGKRRVGKTELIKEFIQDKPSIYFLAGKRTTREELAELGRIMGSYFQDSLLLTRGFGAWLEVFQYLRDKAPHPLVLAIDEYPYLVEVDRAISSIFQKGWDEYLKESKIFLILSGSSISMMESEALIYKSPLYGRRTGQLLLKPFSFFSAWQFFPQKTFEAFLGIYAVVGGLPAYLLQIDKSHSLKQNIQKKIFQRTEFLFNEIAFILKEELREPKNYLSILKAIAWGKTRFSEIVNETGFEKNIIHKYCGVLERLQLVERGVPVTEKDPQKSKKGMYRISDHFTRFWFQYVFPYGSDLEMERWDSALEKWRTTFSILEGGVYERVCHEILQNATWLPFPLQRVGRWWEKNKEIDLVGLNAETQEIIFGEAKWTNKPIGINIFEDLRAKASAVEWHNGKRREYYALFGKSGFTPHMRAYARDHGVFLIHRDRLVTLKEARSVKVETER